jgi:hypothetical protein
MKNEFMKDLPEISDIVEKEIKINQELGNITKRIEYSTPKPWMQSENHKKTTEDENITITINAQRHKEQEITFELKQESDNYNTITGLNINTPKITYRANNKPNTNYFDPVPLYQH